MRTLVLDGSPKGGNGNTLKLTRAFLDGAGIDGARVIEASAAGVAPCRGCFACWKDKERVCVIDDAMRGILREFTDADIVVWSFPLYFYGLPGALKTVLDRLLPAVTPYRANAAGAVLSGDKPQRHAVISTCGFGSAAGLYDAVTAMFDRVLGADAYARLYCGQGELLKNPMLRCRTDAYLEAVRRAGAEFAAGGITEKTQNLLAQPFLPPEEFEALMASVRRRHGV